MPDYGLTTEGFVIKPESVIREGMEEDIREAFGSSFPLGDKTLQGQLIGIQAAAVAEVWEVAEDIAAGDDPDQASGTQLVAISALTGTTPNAATHSTVNLLLTGDASTVVTTGSRAEVTSTEKLFEAVEDSEPFAAATAWASATAYALDDIRTNNDNIYVCITPGTSAGSGGPTTEDTDITDNTVHWRFLGAGTAYIEVAAQSVDTGPIVGVAYDISTINTAVAGWLGVSNLLDATLGQDADTDETLRERREAELSQAGTGTVDALRAALLEVANVTAVTIFQNVEDTADADGVPGHAFEALVQGGATQAIADCILENHPIGIKSHCSGSGAVTTTATDDAGNVHTIKFTRPTEILIYVVMTLNYDNTSDYVPATHDTLVEQAIVEWGDALDAGYNVRSSAVGKNAFLVEGVLETPTVFIGTAPAPGTSVSISIAQREKAVFDTTRITVTSTGVTP